MNFLFQMWSLQTKSKTNNLQFQQISYLLYIHEPFLAIIFSFLKSLQILFIIAYLRK